MKEKSLQPVSFSVLDDIVCIVKDEPRVDSRIMSKILGIENKSLIRQIRTYPEDFRAFGFLRFQSAKIGARGRPETFVMLNEAQATLLMSYSKNTRQVRGLKQRLVKAFSEAKKLLSVRQDSKGLRHIETESVKLLIEHAEKQGSRNADKYYVLVTKLVYKSLFKDKIINRDQLTTEQLTILSAAEIAIKQEIEAQLKNNPDIHYKEIYKQVKNRVTNITSNFKGDR